MTGAPSCADVVFCAACMEAGSVLAPLTIRSVACRYADPIKAANKSKVLAFMSQTSKVKVVKVNVAVFAVNAIEMLSHEGSHKVW